MTEPQSQIIRDALAILKVMIEGNAVAGGSMTYGEIFAKSGVTRTRFDVADSFLLQGHYVSGTMGADEASRWLSVDGIEYYERSLQPGPGVSIGAIIQGDVSHSSIQAVATAVNSTVNQVIEATDPEDLVRQLHEAVEDIVAAVKGQLTIDELTPYLEAARSLKAEVQAPAPDKGRIRKLLAALSFLGDVEGGIELASRAIQLAQLVAPHLPLLIAYLNQL